MRLLIDECLSARLGVLLSDAGHDAVHVGDLALLGATEETVMAAALDDSRIVVSADTDFGEVLAASIAQYPSVILLRRKGRTAEQQASILLANFAAVENDLAVGAMVVVLQDRLRVRRLPIHRRE